VGVVENHDITYILQVMAHDGGLGASQNVTVNVRPADGSRWKRSFRVRRPSAAIRHGL